VGNKTSATRRGFSVLLKYFELEARFPRHAGEVPKSAVRVRGRAGEGLLHPNDLSRYTTYLAPGRSFGRSGPVTGARSGGEPAVKVNLANQLVR
jgi:hypothetical protein